MSLILASSLDTAAAGPLRSALRGAVDRGEPLVIDGGAVEEVGQACLQVLAAARAAAVAGRLPYRIDGASPALAEMAALAALDVHSPA